jgi:hypothetical protein
MEVVRAGQGLLAEARSGAVPRAAVASVLPCVLARRDLARWPRVATPRLLGDRLAVVVAGVLGRV